MIESEDRFIPADQRCPHPERWHSIDGDAAEEEVAEMLGAFVIGLQPDLVIETGAGLGTITRRLVAALARHPFGRLIALEPDGERFACLVNLGGRLCSPLAQSSLEFELRDHDDRRVDLWISDSLYETRVPEVLRALERGWLRRGASVVFHDTRPDAGSHRIPSGRSLCDEIDAVLVARGWLRAIEFPTPRGLTLCEVV